METHSEILLVLFLTSKCSPLSPEAIAFLVLVLFLAWFATALLHWANPGGPAWGKQRWSRGTKPNQIPGPRGLPVLGSMNLMANLAHRQLAAEADRLAARRLMAFSLGETRVLITCNPDIAREILNSSVFADRPVKESAYCLMFNRAIGFAPCGVYWRTLRRIASTHLFCPKQVLNSEAQRYEIGRQMVKMIGRSTGEFRVRDVLKRASLNNMMWSVFGRKYELGSASGEVQELSGLVAEGYELLGRLNWSDHLPWLSWLDPQKVRSRCSKLVPRVSRFLGQVIAEHRAQPPTGKQYQDFVDVLLSLYGPDKLSDPDMIAVLWEMIFRGTDTVAVLIEWILARMVLHPDVQSKVHEELDQVVGKSRSVVESDIASLVYLQAVVKEVLRLHPPGPLLSWARLAITESIVDGYHVPAGTTAMVNMWAITRDPKVWSDPLSFKPERFAAEQNQVEFSVMGADLRLAPFGSGRRTCPGKLLGLTTVSFWVASLMHGYEWSPSDQYPVDLSEVLRLSCEMASPLTVKVCCRGIRD
ncbi:Flavonoid 3'-monooxygenase [Bertholletia excelsa]